MRPCSAYKTVPLKPVFLLKLLKTFSMLAAFLLITVLSKSINILSTLTSGYTSTSSRVMSSYSFLEHEMSVINNEQYRINNENLNKKEE